jgi:prepilin-type N-terminal cleavage/methylation domain-containing protein
VRKRTSHANGYTLAEMLVTVAIIGLFVLVSIPAFGSIQRRFALRAATAQLRAVFHATRIRAIARGQHSGLRFFRVGGEWNFAVYDDGDGDGLRNDDIARGVDTLVAPPRVIFPESRVITIGLLDRTIKDPDGQNLTPRDSPVQFNRSALASFSPYGESTPGTIYITDRGRDLWAVRVYGATAKIRVTRYDAATRTWVQP